MPTYEFLCRGCRLTFEVISSIAEHERAKADRGAVKCTRCESVDVEPQISEVQVKTKKKSA